MTRKFMAIVLIQVVLLAGIIGYRQYWVSTGGKVMLKTVPVDPWNMFRGDYMTLSYDISRFNLTRLNVREEYRRNDKVFALLQKQADGTYEYSAIAKTAPQSGMFIQGRVTNVFDESHWEVSATGDAGTTRKFDLQWSSGAKVGEKVLFCTHRNGQTDLLRYTEKYAPQCGKDDEAFSGSITGSREIKEKMLFAEYGIEDYFVEEGRGSVDALAKQNHTGRDEGNAPHEQEGAQQAQSGGGQSRLHVEVALRKDGKALISKIFIDGREVK